MKRYGNLYTQIVERENLIRAHKNARKGKGHCYSVRKVDRNLDAYVDRLQQMLVRYKFKTARYTVFRITEPKERLISRLPYFPDRIVHHAIMQVCQPIWDKIFICDSYAAIPGKGIHAGLARLKDYLKDQAGTKYCFKFDIKKFYPSVDPDIMAQIVRRKIKCKPTIRLLDNIIHSAPGLPIGNYLSQYLSNLYLNDFDHWLKEKQRCRYYIRYCDDALVLHHDKRRLHDLRHAVERYLEGQLKLRLNAKSQVFPVDSRGIDFLGYKTFHRFSLLRKSSKKKFVAKVQAILNDPPGPVHTVSSIMSYLGWLKHCDARNLTDKYIHKNDALQVAMQRASDKLGISNPLIQEV